MTTLAPVANEIEVIRKTKLDFSAPLTWRFRSRKKVRFVQSNPDC